MRIRSVAALAVLAFGLAGCAQEPVNSGLLAGAKWEYSLDGQTYTSSVPLAPAEQDTSYVARCEFDAPDISGAVVLELEHCLPALHRWSFTLNGEPIRGQLDRVKYRTYCGIDPALLRPGRNVLAAAITVRNKSASAYKTKSVRIPLACRLTPVYARDLRIQTGPVLGACGSDYFTVSCRTTLDARVELKYVIDGAGPESPMEDAGVSFGTFHRFFAPVPGPGRYRYEVRAMLGGQVTDVSGGVVTTLPGPDDQYWQAAAPLRFIATGDSRTDPDAWADVAAAILRHRPQLLLFNGDMVTSGLNDWQWDQEYFGRARELLATTPYYPVIGNHEQNAPVMSRFFWTPGGDGTGRNWWQRVGPVLFIGIDGTLGWPQDGANEAWLRDVLSNRSPGVPFVFVMSHYPAWSSSSHGVLGADGLPKEREVRQTLLTVMPALEEYNVTALLSGHDHVYERSEPPGGVCNIICGGAGAPLRGKTRNAALQNRYSAVFATSYNYCLFEVRGATCTMKAYSPSGRLIDSRTFQARTVFHRPPTSRPVAGSASAPASEPAGTVTTRAPAVEAAQGAE